MAIIAVLPHAANLRIARGATVTEPTLALPGAGESIGGWKPAAAFTTWKPVFEGPSALLRQAFEKDGQSAAVYVGYYRNQTYQRKLVSSNNVLVVSEDPTWVRVRSGARHLELGSSAVNAYRAELRGDGGSRLLVWQWYWIGGHMTSSDYVAKLLIAWSRLTGRGDDAAVIIVYSEVDSGKQGEVANESLLRAIWPNLESALVSAKGSR